MSNEKLPKATATGRPLILNTNILLTGAHGSGKTTFAEEILVSKKKRLVIIDPKREYGREEFCKVSGVKYDAIIDDFKDLQECLKKKIVEGTYRIVAQIPEMEPTIFKLIGDDPATKESILKNTTLLVEEATYWMNSYKIDDSLRSHLQYGRHNKNNLIATTRIPYEAHPLLRSESDIIISFAQSERNSIKYFAEIDPDMAGELKDLDKGEYRLIKGSNEEFLKFISEP